MHLMNCDQLFVYKCIEKAIYGKNEDENEDTKENKNKNDNENDLKNFYFLDAPGGTGKTFVFNTLLARVRKVGDIALAVATSGIAALLLEGGVTAHSRFKIPLNIDEISTCNININ